MVPADVPAADAICRTAFGTFLGMPDPGAFFSGQEYIRHRVAANPQGAFVACDASGVVGSNLATAWGSVGFFGPLSVSPAWWNGGVGAALVAPVLEFLNECGVRHAGLFTFADSVKHGGLYRRFGFWPRALTLVVGRAPQVRAPGAGCHNLRTLNAAQRATALAGVGALCDGIYAGFDPTHEAQVIEAWNLGDTVLLDDGSGFAMCHVGPGTEAGPGVCYVKAGAVASGAGAARRLGFLLDAVEAYAGARNLSQVSFGVSTGSPGLCRAVLGRGYRVRMQGIGMHRPNRAGLTGPGMFVLHDWR